MNGGKKTPPMLLVGARHIGVHVGVVRLPLSPRISSEQIASEQIASEQIASGWRYIVVP